MAYRQLTDFAEKLVCPACGSRNVLFMKRTKSYWCRKCGEEFNIVKDKKKKGGTK